MRVSVMKAICYVVMAVVLPLLFLPFGERLLSYATAPTCAAQQISVVRDCIGKTDVQVVRAGNERRPNKICDGEACSEGVKDNYFLVVLLPHGDGETYLRGNGSFSGFDPGEKVTLVSWNGTFIGVHDHVSNKVAGLNGWHTSWFVLTLIGAIVAWLMNAYAACRFVLTHPRSALESSESNPAAKDDSIIVAFAPFAGVAAISFLVVFSIVQNAV